MKQIYQIILINFLYPKENTNNNSIIFYSIDPFTEYHTSYDSYYPLTREEICKIILIILNSVDT